MPDSDPILDVSPISLRYHIRSFLEFMVPVGRGYGEYGTNTRNFGVSFGQTESMVSELDVCTSGHRPGKEHVEDDDNQATAEYSKGDLVLEGLEDKWGNGDRVDNDDAGTAGNEDEVGIGTDDDDPTTVIVVEVLADEADEQPILPMRSPPNIENLTFLL